jgi:hypothetical protein
VGGIGHEAAIKADATAQCAALIAPYVLRLRKKKR